MSFVIFFVSFFLVVQFANSLNKPFIFSSLGGGEDKVECVQVGTDGSIIVFGGTNSFGEGELDQVILKMDNDGNVDFTTVAGASLSESVIFGIETSGGDFILVGGTTSYGGMRAMISKYNSTGDLQWTRTFGGGVDDLLFDVIETSDNNFVAAGYSSISTIDFMLVKFSGDGTLIWDQYLNDGLGTDKAYSLSETSSDSGILLAGYTDGFGGVGMNIMLAKFDSSGTKEWVKTIGGAGEEYIRSLEPTSDGGMIASGATSSYGAGVYDAFLIKFNGTAHVEWARTVGWVGDDLGQSAVETMDGGFAMLGYSLSEGYGGADFMISKWNATGGLEWVRTLGGVADEYPRNIAADHTDGSVVVSGFTGTWGTVAENSFLLARIGANGEYCGVGTIAQEWDTAVVKDWAVTLVDQSLTASAASFAFTSREFVEIHPTLLLESKCEGWESACPPYYFGTACNVTTCIGEFSNDTSVVCNGHGSCVEFDVCVCDPPYELKPNNCVLPNYFEYIRSSENYTAVFECDTELAVPGGREGGCGFYFQNGKSYIFGGQSFDGGQSKEFLHNDVWTTSKGKDDRWCYIRGNKTVSEEETISNDVPMYSELGVYSPANEISGRSYFGSFETEFSFFVVGGRIPSLSSTTINDTTNELWEFIIIGSNKHEWRILQEHTDDGDDETIIFSPRSHLCAASSSSDGYSKAYIFGGQNNGDDGRVYYNDLWKYDIQSNQFEKLRDGNNSTFNQTSSFFDSIQKHEAHDALIDPPQRTQHLCWIDPHSQHFFIFGGKYVNEESGNDVWLYNFTESAWMWIAGGDNNTVNTLSSDPYVFNSGNLPSVRSGMIGFSRFFNFFGLDRFFMFLGGGWSSGNDEYTGQDMWMMRTTFPFEFKVVNYTVTEDYINTQTDPSSNVIGSRFGGVGIAERNKRLLVFGGLGV